MNLDTRLFELAGRQHALVTASQVRRLGLSAKQIRTRIQRGVLERVSPIVLRITGSPATEEQRILAAVWSSGPTAVASHLTAAWMWSLDSIDPPAGRPHVSLLRPATGDRRLATVHQTTMLDRRDLTTVRGIPLTTPARTLVDLGATVPAHRLEVALDGALRDGLVSPDQLRRKVKSLRRPGRTGVGPLETALGVGDSARPESWLERTALELFASAGLPTPECQRVVDASGTLRRLDFSFAGGAVVAEVSGHRTHSTRRQRQADAERRNRLLLLGIAIWEFTYEDVVERPDWVNATLGRALEQAGTPTEAR